MLFLSVLVKHVLHSSSSPHRHRPFKRQQYSMTDMANAISAVRNNEMKKLEASKHFGVPLTTLLDKLSGKSPEWTNYGRTEIQAKVNKKSGKSRRPKRCYTRESMLAALDAVRTGRMSRKEASVTFDVPYSTLLDKLCGRSPE